MVWMCPRLWHIGQKNLAVEAVLGDHKKQYPRLRDYAQTVMDTNPGSRVVVTTVTPAPTKKSHIQDPDSMQCFTASMEQGRDFYRGVDHSLVSSF